MADVVQDYDKLFNLGGAFCSHAHYHHKSVAQQDGGNRISQTEPLPWAKGWSIVSSVLMYGGEFSLDCLPPSVALGL